MKYCRYCGKPIDDDSDFCTYCGNYQNVDKSSRFTAKSIKVGKVKKWFKRIKITGIVNKYPKSFLFSTSIILAFFSVTGDSCYFQKIDFYIVLIMMLLIFVFAYLSCKIISFLKETKCEDKEYIEKTMGQIKSNFKHLVIILFVTFLFTFLKLGFANYEDIDTCFILYENTWLIFALIYSVRIIIKQVYEYLSLKIDLLKRSL